MEPKTKLQKEVVELSSKLHPITKKQEVWGLKHCLDKFVHKSRKTLYCLECGHAWKDERIVLPKDNGCKCPSCKAKLIMYPEYKSYCEDAAYYAIMTISGRFQVMRLIHVSKTMRIKKPARFYASEVMQHWIDSSGTVTTMAINVNGMSWQVDQWVWGSKMSIKVANSQSSFMRFNLNPYKIYPKSNLLPIFKRNGYNFQDCGVSPQKLLPLILKDRYAETLLKTNQLDFLEYYSNHSTSAVVRWWPSIKICLRNNYIVKDATMWFDYIELLQYFNLDLHNAHYVCPKDLKVEHDKLMDRKRKIQQRKKLEEQRQKLESDQINYAKQKGRFFGIQLTDGKILVKTIESVEELMKEGDTLHHCVYTNEYHKKPNSLIMSARIDGKPIETIEVSLKTLKVVQSRGLHNKSTDYHDRIINLVQANTSQIAKKLKHEVHN